MRVGILGSGLMGAKLGTLFARAGHDVVFSYARSRQKLERLAHDAHGGARAGTPAEGVRDADAVLLAVHWLRMDDVFAQAGDLAGKVVVTCSLPMNADDTGLVIGHTSSGAEELAKRLPAGRVVSAFGTVPSEVFFAVFDSKGQSAAPSMMYCGDDAAAKQIAATLITDVGFVPVDGGDLRVARYMEPFALLMGRLAYGSDEGPEVAYRFVRHPN
jgi:predicted dinucleotide-binding enzyme